MASSQAAVRPSPTRASRSRGEWRPGAAIGYVAVVCTVVCVPLDFEQPQRGWITVSQETMRRVLEGMRYEGWSDSRVPNGAQAVAIGQR